MIGVIIVILCGLGYSLIPTGILRTKNRLCRKRQGEEKVLFLTFDDGPTLEYTPLLLELLKKHKVRATFFVVGNQAKKHPEILKTIITDGHLVGSHGLEHRNGLWISPQYHKKEFPQVEDILKETDVKVEFFRPPWGIVNVSMLWQLYQRKYKLVLWQVMIGDWEGNCTSDILVKRLKKKTKNGNILCLHDGRGKNHAPLRMIEALDKMIPIWKQEGYSFGKIDEI